MKGMGWALLRSHARQNTALAAMSVVCLSIMGGCLNIMVAAGNGAGLDPSTAESLRQNVADLGDLVASLMGWTLGISVFTGIFLIASTMAFTIDARVKELALLRLLGASRRQIGRSVTWETMGVAVVAGIVAAPLGWPAAAAIQAIAVRAQFSPAGLDVTPVWWAMVILPVIGAVIAFLGVRGCARRAGRADPMQAISEITPARRAMTWGRWAIAGIGIIALIPLVRIGPEQRDSFIASTIGICLVSIVVLSAIAPLLVPAVTALLSRLLGMVFPAVGHLAAEHARFAARRTAALALPVLLVVGLSGGMLSTIWTANHHERPTTTGADLVITPRAADSGGEAGGGGDRGGGTGEPPAGDMEGLTKVDGVSSALPMTDLRVTGRDAHGSESPWYLTAINVPDAVASGLIKVTAGSVAGAGSTQKTGTTNSTGESVPVEQRIASANSMALPLGSHLTITPPHGEPVTLTVTAMVKVDPLVDGYVFIDPLLAREWGADWVDSTLVTVDRSRGVDAVRRSLSARLPGADVSTGKQVLASRAAAQDRENFQAVGALVGGGAAMGACAIVMTCLSGAADRRREFAVLSRVGATSRQVLGAALVESVLVIVVAAILVVGEIGVVAARLWTMPATGGASAPTIPVGAILAILGVSALLALSATALGTWWQVRHSSALAPAT